jgi:hypothetical protein
MTNMDDWSDGRITMQATKRKEFRTRIVMCTTGQSPALPVKKSKATFPENTSRNDE